MTFNSAHYWEERYQEGKDSGPGSYGRLAEYKAKFLNSFVKDNRISRVIELGCGDGNQLSLASYPMYIGLDVSKKSIEMCSYKFQNDTKKSFFYYDSFHFFDFAGVLKSDLSLSLDVIFHLVEDSVFEKYMQQLFSLSNKFVIIYSSNHTDEVSAEHVRHRKFTDYVSSKFSHEWKLVSSEENPFPYDGNDPVNTSFAKFFIYKKV